MNVVNNKVEVALVIPQGVSRLKQIFVAHGDEAWGQSLGSQSSTVTFTKVEQGQDNAESYGGIDLQKIDLHVDAASGAVSFEVNDAVVTVFQERLFGLEPVLVSSVPLVDLQGFLMVK